MLVLREPKPKIKESNQD